MDIYESQKKTPDKIYEAFNTLVFSNDVRVMFKMISKIKIYHEVKHLNGDILEFGVFMGASVALWLQLVKMYEPNGLTKVIGFDFFNKNNTLKNTSENSKKLMTNVLNRCKNENDLNMETILNKCNNILPNRLKLIKGDACITSLEFKNNNPGARIKLLYLDMDLDEPTYATLKNLWDKIVIDGIIILDEYGYHNWDESNGVDRFLKTIKGEYKLENTNICNPTMIIKKIS